MKKNIFTLFLCMSFLLTAQTQTQLKNKEHCKYVMSKKIEVIEMVSIFKTTSMSINDKENLKTFFYQLNQSIFNIVFLDQDIVKFYHISDMSYQFIEEALIAQNVYAAFVNSIEYSKTVQNDIER